MYRIFPRQTLVLAFSWFVCLIFLLFYIISENTHFQLKYASIPTVITFLIPILLCNKVWRRIWRKYPYLGANLFPDLNGEWTVELRSNWPRHLQVLNAAINEGEMFDIRSCEESELAPLTPILLRAQITQTFWKLEMRLWNPQQNTPIRKSDTIFIDPFPRKGHLEAGICYFYKQENQTDNLSDEGDFYGAARLEYHSDSNTLSGRFWTARMWRRAINTAGEITFRDQQTSEI